MEKILNKIINEVVTKVLVSNGFKKRGATYLKENDTCTFTIKLYVNWLEPNEVTFTLRTGIFLKCLFGSYYLRTPPKNPGINDSIYQMNINKLANRSHEWYRLNLTTNIKELKQLIEKDIKDYIFPYYEQLLNTESIIEFFELADSNGIESPHFLTILYKEYGYEKRAQMRMEKVFNECNFDGQKEFTKQIAKRIGLQIFD